MSGLAYWEAKWLLLLRPTHNKMRDAGVVLASGAFGQPAVKAAGSAPSGHSGGYRLSIQHAIISSAILSEKFVLQNATHRSCAVIWHGLSRRKNFVIGSRGVELKMEPRVA